MDAAEVIATYERILEITDGMLAAARVAEWDRVAQLEQATRAEIQRLLALGDDRPLLNEPLRRRKAQIIRKVLDDDAEIRRITEPWMAQLEQMIGSVSNQRRLAGSYGTQPPG